MAMNKGRREEVVSKHDTPFLYIFIAMEFETGYQLYRIDALKYYHNKQDAKDIIDLQPILVFPIDTFSLPFCTMTHIGAYLYFVGQQMGDFFMIRKSDLNSVIPSENNTVLNNKSLLTQLNFMHGPKQKPYVFVASQQLYVLSQPDDDGFFTFDSPDPYQFEVYDPQTETWKCLDTKPEGSGLIKTHVFLEAQQTVYFTTHFETLLSFNLPLGKWNTLISYRLPEELDPHIEYPSFDACAMVVGNKMFGGFFHHDADLHLTIVASPYTDFSDTISDKFMRVTAAGDRDFWDKFKSVYTRINYDPFTSSSYLVTLDGKDVLCFVSYRSHAGSFCDPHENHVLLTFFYGISESLQTSTTVSKTDIFDSKIFYALQRNGDSVSRCYFSVRSVRRAQFCVKTTDLNTCGRIVTCLFDRVDD